MPPRRRSSRLRASAATPGKSSNYASNHLESLIERDETPTSGAQSNIDTVVSSPVAPRTPATSSQQPSFAERHPSHAHHSTTQKPDSGLRLGFTDIQASGNNQPSGVTQQTPSKIGISDSSFEFTFARPGPQLGPEAQRMMDELRGEALRIKAKLAAEREEEKRREGESSGMVNRKIAQPKGKVGRFSEVHMAEFKKMDSIAGHPSAFRAQTGRAPSSMNTGNGLKRTQSKAQLDDRDEAQKNNELSEAKGSQSERLENTAPAKRARKHVEDDTSSARPVSRSNMNEPLPATPTRPLPSTLAAITTPTQASLARGVSIKKPTSQIPTLARSPSKPNLNETPKGLTRSPSKPNLNEAPRGLAKSSSKPNLVETPRGITRSLTTNNISSIPRTQAQPAIHSPSRLDRVRSILRYPSSSMKKQTSIPSLSRSPSKPDFGQTLPPVPVTPGANAPIAPAATPKHVNFTPDVVNKHASMTQNSPSPVKSGIPRSTSKINLGVKPHTTSSMSTAKEVYYPKIGIQSSPAKKANEVEYPSLTGVRPLPEQPRQQHGSQAQPPPSVPGTFTFRSDHTINFGSSPKGFGSSPGQSSVRQVRQSIMPNNMPGSFPSNKENTPPIPSLSHGMANKKRRRVDSDDEREEETERSPKKHKPEVAEGPLLMAPKLQGKTTTPGSKTSSPSKKKGVLSLSRLNMLARPKVRR